MIFWFVTFLAILCLTVSVLPFVPLPHGIFRVWEFPRTQILIVSVATSILAYVTLANDPWQLTLFALLLIASAIQVVHIARFTPFWRRRSADFKGEPADAPKMKLLISNVKMGNRNYRPTQALLQQENPDIGVFMETDQKWIDALRLSSTLYPFQIECPIDNGYGMFIVSKYRIYDHKIRYLLNPEVPSFDGMVDHPDGDRFRLIVVHPEPPLAIRDTMGRDAEIAFVGKLVRHDDQPVIVTGDLNDVAWSRTTRRFLRISRLLDPREGRGQFNTFDARYLPLRWPLDHIFHSPHFQLVRMARMPFTGSDHFPMFYELALTDRKIGRRQVDAASDEDLEEAAELIEIEKERDLRPVGHDWEDK